jgi:hypothetical protein
MKIYELLKMSQNQYDLLVYGLWLEYCSKKAFYPSQVQLLMANNGLFIWWNGNLEVVEEEFRQEAQPYLHTMTPQDAYKLYIKNTAKLAFYYSSPLFERALTPKNHDHE